MNSNYTITDHNRFIRKKSKDAKALSEKVFRKWMKCQEDGMDYGASVAHCLECFDLEGLTERRLKGVIERRALVINPKTAALTEAMLIVRLSNLVTDIDVSRENCDVELESIDMLMDSGVNEVMVESMEKEVSLSSGKDIEDPEYKIKVERTTKRVPILTARKQIEDRKIKLLDDFIGRVNTLMGRDVPMVNLNIVGDVITPEKREEKMRIARGKFGLSDEIIVDVGVVE